jgi:hypothetical protein
MIMKKYFLLLHILLLSTLAFAQTEKSSDLYQIIKEKDSLLFNLGFNNCDISQFEKLVSEKFEFYHDQSGIKNSKSAFINSIQNGLCKLNYKPKRVLVESSLEVYPLNNKGTLYGAIETGIHHFYAIEKDSSEYLTSIAKFNHIWILENGNWKLSKGLSYDHKDFEKTIDNELLFKEKEVTERWIKQKSILALGIENIIPNSLGKEYSNNFNRYTNVVTPNGGKIHIVAQSNLTDEQIVRARSTLEHFLENYPGSKYGSDKSELANKMSENGAILTLLNGQDDGNNPVEVNGQALFENEIQVEGHPWYINQEYNNHRDATYEEILHLVHDYGIGIDGHNSFPGAMPEYQSEIREAQKTALSNNLWGIDAERWINELIDENSLTQEYLAALIDSYYGLWGAWTDSNTHGMWGIYVAKTRDEILTEDPIGAEIMNNKFFHPHLTYNARIDSSFNGNFSLRFDSSKPYTHHSQYLKDITLLGSNDISVSINQLDNNITGNQGINTVIFSGNSSEYILNISDNKASVIDKILDRDGINILQNIEKLEFTDQTLLILN